jgi:uncharacterized protein (DUF58 family)
VPARRPPAPEELLAPAFLARLRLLKDLFFRRRNLGELQGAGFGPTPEFDTHRSYEPGDDLRYIDWNVYARMEKLLLKLFILEKESQVCVLLDSSDSMRLGGGRKSAMAARFAAAFSYLALCAGRPLVVGAFAERFLAARGPLQTLEQFPEALRFVGSPPAGRATRFGSSVAEFLATRRGRCFLIVVSDFFQQDDVRPEIAWLRQRRHDLHLVQVVEDHELEPVLRGACTVTDAEGEGELTLVAGHDFMSQVRSAIREYVEGVGTTCRGLAVPHALVRASQPFEQAFLAHLAERAAG